MTEAEIKRAQKQAEADAEWLGLLLLLAFKKKDSATAKAVEWDASKGRFRYRGRLVAIKSIRSYLSRIEERSGARLTRLTRQLERGEISIGQWQREFERSITTAHLLAGGLALGGIAVAAKNQLIIDRIGAELAFADSFGDEIRKKKLSWAMIRSRARRYMQAAHITFQQTEQKARETVGLQTECRRIRRASESCKPCIALARRGWMPIAEMPPIGTLPKSDGGCEIYCRCYLEYR